jgi:hypothetical protein
LEHSGDVLNLNLFQIFQWFTCFEILLHSSNQILSETQISVTLTIENAVAYLRTPGFAIDVNTLSQAYEIPLPVSPADLCYNVERR